MSYVSDIAFTKSVKAIQTRKGSRISYAKLEQSDPWQSSITPELAALIAEKRSAFLGTASSDGRPYIQHRGGPPGFIKVIDEKNLAFADFKGNRQFISQGNLAENPKAFLFLIDYYTRTRIKIWGTAKVIEDQPELLSALMPDRSEYRALPEQIVSFSVEAWDRNCPQHIPKQFKHEDVEKLVEERDRRIAELEREVRVLRGEA